MKMKAVIVPTLGAPLEYVGHEISDPEVGEVQVRIAHCGLNFADTLMQFGKYQVAPSFPHILGMEFSGEVVALGENVAPEMIGKRVLCLAGRGGLAEFANVHIDNIYEIPEGLASAEAACAVIAHGTSYVALVERAGLQTGQRLLVLGAAGGVGQSAVQVGKSCGSYVVAVVSDEMKRGAAKDAGADEVWVVNPESLQAQIAASEKFDVVYDPVGGDRIPTTLKALKRGGVYLPIGFAGGDVPQIPANILLVKNLSVFGINWTGLREIDAVGYDRAVKTVLDRMAKGKLRVDIAKTYPLCDAKDALDDLKSRRVRGRIIVDCQSGDAP